VELLLLKWKRTEDKRMQDGAMVPSCLRFPSLYSERGGRSWIPAELSDRKNDSHM
jgi:hypothetical protein